jgi:thiol-disulfide isomerase/thioredoxin
MYRKVMVSLIVLAVLSMACMPKAQPEPEVVMPEAPQVEEAAPVEMEEQPVVAEEPVAEEVVVEEAMPEEETPEEPAIEEMNTEPVVLSIPRDFEIKLYQGQEMYSGATVPISTLFAEGKPVVVNFYAGLCPLCNVELPAMQAAYNKYNDQVKFVIVDIGPFVGLGSEQDGINMIANLGVTIPGGSISDLDVIRDYGVFGTPAVSIFNPDGSLYFQHNGVMSEAQIDEQIAGLVQ